MIQLLNEIKSFKLWANTADTSYGEWETDYLHWDKINKAAEQLIQEIPVKQWNEDLLNEFLYILARDNEFLYILARDNECEIILYHLINFPNQLVSLAKHTVSFPDQDARWQIAYGLGELDETTAEIQRILEKFLVDEHEYVRRRASFAYEKKF